MTIEQFKKDRNEALLSLNKEKIEAYMVKYGLTMPAQIFWQSVHKAITGCKDLPLEFRKQSKKWLSDRNLDSLDDGEL